MSSDYEQFKLFCQNKRMPHSFENTLITDGLKLKGLQITTTDSHYYLKDDIQPLSEKHIRSGINKDINAVLNNIDIVYETTSTNKAIRLLEQTNGYSVLLAEYQSDGQGRRAKQWSSPLGSNIYLSIRFHLDNNQFAHFIPLITGVSICDALSMIGVEGCKIKWPNDIYLDGKKLGGILVESFFNKLKGQEIVVGVGLNINMQCNDKIDQQWTSLRNELNTHFNRNIILSTLLSVTLEHYNQLSTFDFKHFNLQWHQLDLLNGKKIIVMEEHKSYEAIARGIAENGALIIDTEQGQSQIFSADVSIKPTNINF